MIKNLVFLKDSIGQPYVGVKYSLSELKTELEVWSSLFTYEELNKLAIFASNRDRRDGESFHITLINAMEWKALSLSFSKTELDSIFIPLYNDIVFEGIGRVVKDGNEAHFIVVTSEKLNNIRTSLGLELKDLHITLGFDRKDVHGVSKGVETIIKKLPKDE